MGIGQESVCAEILLHGGAGSRDNMYQAWTGGTSVAEACWPVWSN